MARTELFGISWETWLQFLIIVAASLVVARLVYILLRRTLDDHINMRRSKVFARLVEYTIVAIGLYLGLFLILGLDITAALASAGIIGIAIAFAAQQIIQNFMAGLLMAVDRRVQLEDWVEIVGDPPTGVAKVKDISLTRTVLVDLSGRQIYVPNSVLFNSLVINYTKAGLVKVLFEVKVPTASVDKATSIILEVAAKEEKVLPQVGPAEQSKVDEQLKLQKLQHLFEDLPPAQMFVPRVMITKLEGRVVTLSVRIWIVEVQKRDEIVSSLMRLLLDRCQEEGISFV